MGGEEKSVKLSVIFEGKIESMKDLCGLLHALLCRSRLEDLGTLLYSRMEIFVRQIGDAYGDTSCCGKQYTHKPHHVFTSVVE